MTIDTHFIELVVLGLLAIGAYAWYASIITKRNRVSEALSGIDVQLQQRHDLIPNVLAIAQRFMQHERGLMSEITTLRGQAASQLGEKDFSKIASKFEAEAKLSDGLGRLMVLSENYPQLRSDGPMIEAQRAYAEIEANIAAARRFYNSAVGDLRNRTQIFPGSILRLLAGIVTLPPFFEAAESTRQPISAEAILKA